MQQHCRPSSVALCFVFLAIGFTPFLLGCYFGILELLEGGSSIDNIWDNEIYAWGLLLLAFQIAALVCGLRIRKARRIASSIIISLAAVGICMYAFSNWFENLKPQSKADDEQLHLVRFWTDGGGWHGAYVVIPALAVYLILLVRDIYKGKQKEGRLT